MDHATTPALRVRALNGGSAQPDGDYVLYWMTANRRLGWNFALDRALEWCRELKTPLLVFEPLRCGYRWASARHHRFVIDGMADHERALSRRKSVHYFPYVEPKPGAGSGLLASLAERAAVVVADDYPCFFLPRMLAAAAGKLTVKLEAVDANGLLPIRAPDKVFQRAYDLRRYLQRALPPHLEDLPHSDPLKGLRLPAFEGLPPKLLKRWPRASAALLAGGGLEALPIDQSVGPVALRGGPAAGAEQLEAFLQGNLRSYGERNHPDNDVASGLSPYLHFGHVGAHQVFEGVGAREAWTPAVLEAGGRGQREGWWQMSAAAEAFMDQLVTWRELGFNMCTYQPEAYASFESLPGWAKETLEKHAGDRRPYLYTLEQFAASETHDPIWNAAQTQLRCEGVIHGYLRMLWGKKIFEWTPTPHAALDVLIELNNRYALDGRDPNSYSGIFWCLGRYDRAWGPERPIYGKIRYMTSDSTRRKLRLKGYLERYASGKAHPG